MKRVWLGVLTRCRPNRVLVSKEKPMLIPEFLSWEIGKEREGSFELLAGGQSGKMALFATEAAIRC